MLTRTASPVARLWPDAQHGENFEGVAIQIVVLQPALSERPPVSLGFAALLHHIKVVSVRVDFSIRLQVGLLTLSLMFSHMVILLL